MMGILEEKAALRRFYREKRKAISPQQKAILDAGLFQTVFADEAARSAKKLLLFASLPAEPDTAPMLHAALEHGYVVALPFCLEQQGEMCFYQITSEDTLLTSVSGQYGISVPQPLPQRELTDFSDALCLVPGLVFDRCGYRLGYGGGYYDRFLSRHPEIRTAGLVYSDFVAEALPIEPFDMYVELLYTECGTQKTGEFRNMEDFA